MSINVNVTGNPVKIKHGKYVSGIDYTSKEFDQRRKLRLEQVRQQSKDIAENVRHRVRKEKERQKSEFERKSEKELKKWQAKKLLALQQQYQECVKEVGSAHTRAMLEPNDNEILAKEQRRNNEIAQERGFIAEQEKQIRDNERNYKNALPIQQKRNSRAVEDTRSKLISEITKTQKSPKKTVQRKDQKKYNTDINISRKIIESDTLSEITENVISLSSSTSISSEEQSPRKRICNESHRTDFKKSQFLNKSPLRCQNGTYLSDELKNSNLFSYPLETRISERIRNRPKPPDPIFPIHEENSQESVSKVEVGTDAPKIMNTIGSQTSHVDIKKTIEIPLKPTVSLTGLKSSAKTQRSNKINCSNRESKVLHYDHGNRFINYSTENVPVIEKVCENDLLFLSDNEADDIKTQEKLMFQRDREAILRGNRALEKDQIHRDYRDMLQNLDSLQKKERIASIAEHPQKFHMSNDRLKEKYKQQENRLENMCEPLIKQQKRVVTLKPIKQKPPTVPSLDPFQIKPLEEKDLHSKVNWDICNKNMPKENSHDKQSRTKSLIDMLERINTQRMLLEREIETLPKDSHLLKVLEEMKAEKQCSKENCKIEGCKTCSEHRETKRKVSSSSSELDSTTGTAKDSFKRENKVKKETTKGSKVSHKHKKARKLDYVLKTEGTQTSPIITEKINKEVQPSLTNEKEVDSCHKLGFPSVKLSSTKTQKVQSSSADDNLCEIVIKIKEDRTDGTKIIVNPGANIKNLKNDDLIQIRTSKPEIKQFSSKEKLQNLTSLSAASTLKNQSDIKTKSNKTNVSVSWKEHLSKNSIDTSNGASTSTSYYSPPDITTFQRVDKAAERVKVDEKTAKNILYNLIKNRPQQSNIDASGETTDTSVLDQTQNITRAHIRSYIKTLLSMSRGSIENLGVSTGSDISTPGQSVMGTQANNPELHSILRLLNIKQADLQYLMNISNSRSTSDKHVESVTLSSSSSCSIVWKDKSDPNESNKRDLPKISTPETTIEPDNLDKTNYPDLVTKYTELADNCTERISVLIKKIEKVREDKMKLLQTSSSSSASDKEQSTKYLDPPDKFQRPSSADNKNQTILENKEGEKVNNNLTDAEFLSKCLLDIDMSFAEKLRVESNLKTFLHQAEQPPTSKEKQGENPIEETDFVPFLQDIPKYKDSNSNTETFANLFPPNFLLARSKPPAAIANTARRLNLEVVPHELSTIQEMDTIGSKNVSQRNERSRPASPKEKENKFINVSGERSQEEKCKCINIKEGSNAEKTNVLQKSGRTLNVSELVKIPSDEDISKQNYIKGKAKTVAISKTVAQRDTSSSDSSEKDKSRDADMEKMLHSMGMGWAIATLRRTKETLALTSSSSSLDISLKHQTSLKVSDNNNSSSNTSTELSLREILQQHLLEKISTDGGNVNASMLLKEICNLSSRPSSDRTQQQRTSTPIQRGFTQSGNSADTTSQVPLFPTESDISSVKHNSDDALFLTIPSESEEKSQDKSNP